MSADQKIRVWDIAVRVFHWSLVMTFAVAYLSGDDDNELHVYAGYGVAALVAFRLVWGLIGTKYARFSDFIYGPVTAWRYFASLLKNRPLHYLGHNPLGGWMVIALLLSLTGTCWTGLELYGEEGNGPLAQTPIQVISPALAKRGEDEREGRGRGRGRGGDADNDDYWEDLHEGFADFTLLLVLLHITGVVVSSAAHRENLVKAMITGYKQRRTD